MAAYHHIAFVQVFDADKPEKALRLLENVAAHEAPDLILLPEYCFNEADVGKVKEFSSRFPVSASGGRQLGSIVASAACPSRHGPSTYS